MSHELFSCLIYSKLPRMQSVDINGDISLMQIQGDLEVSSKCHIIIISTTYFQSWYSCRSYSGDMPDASTSQ